MSSENQASSAVRNLRSMFENKASLDSNSPDTRGRSPGGLSSDKENGERRASKVRASFFAVEPPGNMAASVEGAQDGAQDGAELKRVTSAGLRRGSFSEADGDGALSALKKTISEEQYRRLVPEGAIESAVGTPMPTMRPNEGRLGYDESSLTGKEDKEPEKPDKPVAVVEEEPDDVKPADRSDENAVSGKEALPPVTEDLRPSTKATGSKSGKKPETKRPTTNGHPAAISTKAAAKSTPSSMKSPASQPKTPLSATKQSSTSTKTESPASSKAPTKKASRSSLTAPTAASVAHSIEMAEKPPNTKTSPNSKPKPKAREATKPVNLPSHLTAPTASYRAKHESESAPASKTTNLRASTTSRPKPAPTAKPTSRTSLAPSQRPSSRASQTSARRSTAPSDGSFLERMMRPTAASSSKTHDKFEAKSPPRQKAAAPRPKVNGTKPAAKSSSKAETSTAADDVPADEPRDEIHKEPTHDEVHVDEPIAETTSTQAESTLLEAAIDGAAEEISQAGPTSEVNEEISVPTEPTGVETPKAHTNGAADAALEATPAGLGGEETIR